MADGTYDPVLDWLQKERGEIPPLTREAAYDLGAVRLRVRSNSAKASDAIMRALQLYAASPDASGTANRTSDIEVFYVKCDKGPGVSLPFGRGTGLPASHSVPKPSELILGEELMHLRWGTVETFWRPFDLLTSVRACENGPTRVLFAKGADGEEIITRGGAVQDPGEPRWPDLVDAVYIMAGGQIADMCLHAAAVATADRAVILAGPTGSGKTTTALALVRDGFDLLSDEISLLKTRSDGKIMASGLMVPPRVVGTPSPSLSCLEQTLIAGHATAKGTLALPRSLTERGLRRWAQVTALIFLSRDKAAVDHRFWRLAEDDAFVRLTTQQVLDPMGAFRMQRHIDMVAGLLQSCPAYQLSLGRRLDTLPDVVRRIIRDGDS